MEKFEARITMTNDHKQRSGRPRTSTKISKEKFVIKTNSPNLRTSVRLRENLNYQRVLYLHYQEHSVEKLYTQISKCFKEDESSKKMQFCEWYLMKQFQND